MKSSLSVFRFDEAVPIDLLRNDSERNASPRRAAILAITRSIISESGCDQVKMRLIADRSEVTPPTIYALVGGRHDVIHNALQEGLRVKFSLADRRTLLEDVNPCLAFVVTKLDAIEANPSYYRQIDRGARLGMLDISTVKAILDAIERQFGIWINQMHIKGQLDLPRNIALSTIIKTLARQLNIPIAGWAAGEYGFGTLKSDLIAAMILPLFAITKNTEQTRMNRWLDRHA
jgi:AcrR family transcriptional regulator